MFSIGSLARRGALRPLHAVSRSPGPRPTVAQVDQAPCAAGHARRSLPVTACALAVAALLTVGSVPAAAQQIPPAPAPVPVTLDPATTAVLVIDINEQVCRPVPGCIDGVAPHITSLLQNARAAGSLVVFSTPATGSPVVPELAPTADEPIVRAQVPGQDRFFGTPLDNLLRIRHIKTVVITGWRANGSVLYTSFAAAMRRYVVVVPDDGTSSGNPFEVDIARYQLLNNTVANPTNQPLVEAGVTLSRTDLMSFGSAGATAPLALP